MSSESSRNKTPFVVNCSKRKKMAIKSGEKKLKRLKSVCDLKYNVKSVLNNETLNITEQPKLVPPFVKLKRLNFEITGPVPLHKLPVSVTESVKVSKVPGKKTKIEEKHKNLKTLSSVKRTKRSVTAPTILSLPKHNSVIPLKLSHSKRKNVVKELNDTSHQSCFKNVEHCDSNKNPSSTDDNLCDKNSTSSLFCDMNEIISSKTEDRNFFRDDFKMKPITKISVCHCDTTCVPGILDASLIADAYQFFKWHKKETNFSSSCTNAINIPFDKLSDAKRLQFEEDGACNVATLPNSIVQIEEVEIPEPFLESSRDIITAELDLGAITECITTTLNYTEHNSIGEILESTVGTGSTSLLKNTRRICSMNLRKKKTLEKCEAAKLLKNKDPKLKKLQKVATLPIDTDADLSNGVFDNFQNDNDQKLRNCDVQGNLSEKDIQSVMEDNNLIIQEMPIIDGNTNISSASNYEQDSFVEYEIIDPIAHSLEKVMIPKESDSNQPLNSNLSCNISDDNFLLLYKENNKVSTKENPAEFGRNPQSPDEIWVTCSRVSDDKIQSNIYKFDMNLEDQTTESVTCESLKEAEKNVSVVGNQFQLNGVDNTANDPSEFQQISYTKPDEHSSNSRGMYDSDLLDDELDYEPFEASEMEVSETESCTGESEAKQSQSDCKIPVPENTIKVKEIQHDSNNKVLRNSSIEQPVKDSVLKRSEFEPNQNAKLYNTSEIAFNKNSLKFVHNNDLFVNNSPSNLPVNNHDECEYFQTNSLGTFSDSDVSEHVDTSEEKSIENPSTEFYEINNNEIHEGRNFTSYQVDKEQTVDYNEEQPHKNKAERLQKRSVDSEDDSESDGEHSFKRKCANDNKGISVNGEDNSVEELNISKVDPLSKLDDVILSIQQKCENGKIDDALKIANSYISISCSHSVQKDIFTELFFNIMDSFRNLDPPLVEDLCLDTIKSTMEVFYDLNLYDTELCSAIIIECLDVKLTTKYGQALFAFCQKNDVSIHPAAVMSYLNSIEPIGMPLMELVSFLKFISKCKVQLPKAFLKEMWNLLFQDKEEVSNSVISEICALLYCIDSSEVDKDDLKKFVQLCIEKRLWTPVACLICSWVKKPAFIVCLVETIAFCSEDIGFCYDELGKEIYTSEDSVPVQANSMFIQIGVYLLMEAASKKLYDSAFKILMVFHRYKINYIDYQASMYSAVQYIKGVHNPSKIFVFPFTVAFTAVDICLHLDRPKDAFTIFQKLSLNLPKEFDDTLKLEIHSQRFNYLLKISLALLSKDPLISGIKALRSLLTAAQADSFLEPLNDYSNDIHTVYEKYMISILNSQKENLIKEFYSYSYGPQKELFILDCQVLRGLTVFFMKHDMLEDASKLFLLGYTKKIYSFGKPLKAPPWEMTVNCNWTSEEIKLTFLRFIETLTPYLVSKNKTGDFDKWFSVKISIKNVPKMNYSVDCLNECNTIVERVCSVLKGLDSTLQWKLGKGRLSLHLIPETFYKFWFSKFSTSSQPSKTFMVPRNVRISFGESCSQEISDSDCPKQRSLKGVASATYSDDMGLNNNVQSDDSTYLTRQNVPQKKFQKICNSSQLLASNNFSKNIANFSPQKTISTARPDISPDNCVNTEVSDQDSASSSSGTDTFSGLRENISSNLHTPPRIQNCFIPYSPNTTPNVSSSSSPQKSFLQNPNKTISPHIQEKSSPRVKKGIVSPCLQGNSSPRTKGGIVSPCVQEKSPPKTSVNTPNLTTVSSPTFSEYPDHNFSVSNLNFNNVETSSQKVAITCTLLDSNLNDSVNRISVENGLNQSIKSLKPKTLLKRLKKTNLTNKKHSPTCLKFKKTGTTLRKPKTDISEMPPIRITLQNTSAQGEALRIVKPVTVLKPLKASQSGILQNAAVQGEELQVVKSVTVLKPLKASQSGRLQNSSAQGETLRVTKPVTVLKSPLKASQSGTLQNSSVQSETIQIVKPVPGLKPLLNASETEIVDFQESSFQCYVPEDVFLKITNFLKSKVMVKRKDLIPCQQQEKALSLARSFIQRNVVSALDKRTMKLLNDYSDQYL